eukprot:TRINITY_DN13947_c0_g1_i1.p1 TRINITY_DN13947_c0_g1~~TRINITY_DN13947_c0_g1_i1.p1  ORF type:complete len:303 (+),score=62.75 TRINITY_DN13947_c0_g1_i1:25-933(+)
MAEVIGSSRFHSMASLLFVLLLGRAAAFPLTSVDVDRTTFAQLNSSSPQSESIATRLLLPEMQQVFKKAEYAIEVDPDDIVIDARFPDTQVDGSCSHEIKAEHPEAKGTLLKTSHLTFGVANVSWHGASVFADAEADAKLDISTDVCVRVGKKIFGHHCSHIARKTVGIEVLSDGRNGIGITMTASNAHVAKVNGTWSLVFNFHASVVGTVLKWHVDSVHVDKCKIKILGIEIMSVCGTIERHVKDKAQVLTDKVTEVDAPKLLKKLEDKLNTAIGSEVVIPLRIRAPSTDDFSHAPELVMI